jgi:hypothetical protein
MQQQGAPASPQPPQPTQPQPGGQGILGRMRGFMGDNRMALMGMGAGILNNGIAGGPGGAFQGSQLDYARGQDEQARADEQSQRARREQAIISLMTQQGLSREQAQTYVDAGMGGAYLESTMGGGAEQYRPMTAEDAARFGIDNPAGYMMSPENRPMRIDGSPLVQVGGGPENPAREVFSEGSADQALTHIAAGEQAIRAGIGIGQLREALQNAPQGGAQGRIAMAASALGVPIEGLEEAELVDSITNRIIPTLRPPGSGAQSDADLENFKRSIPSLLRSEGGNELILRAIEQVNQYDIQRGQIAAQYEADSYSLGAAQATALYRQRLDELNRALPGSYAQALGLPASQGGQAPQPSQRSGRLTPGLDGVLEYR